nr:glycoside hydrolase family 68 protein [Sporolactobacillus laevolacticus]
MGYPVGKGKGENAGKWYLFVITKGYNQKVDGFPSDNTYLLGYVSDNQTGPYKPLNQTGLVLVGLTAERTRMLITVCGQRQIQMIS